MTKADNYNSSWIGHNQFSQPLQAGADAETAPRASSTDAEAAPLASSTDAETAPRASSSSTDACEIFCFDEPKVRRVKERLDGHDFQEMAQVFKVLADETRLKVAYALCDEQELCVCDVAHIIGSSTATASHHLRLLRNMGIAKHRKEGKLVFYALRGEQLKPFIRLAIEHQREVISVD